MHGPVLKYPGSKWSLADWIISHMPPHTTYLEPFFGSGAIFFTKRPATVETINDIDGNVVNLFRVIRDYPEKLAALIEFTPWARYEYTQVLTNAGDDEYFIHTGDPVEDARRFLVRMWQARGSIATDKSSWRHDVQGRNGSSCPREWANIPARILTTAKRLKMAQIECRPALELIEKYRQPGVLIYADPPYPRKTVSRRMYKHMMTDADHEKLLNALDNHPGPVLLSGYACPLYDEWLKHWIRKTKRAIAELGREREEVLWLNPVAAASICQSLFDEVGL